jgi:hypothetical protein
MELSHGQRMEVERKLQMEERAKQRGNRRIPGALMENDEFSEDDELNRQMRFERMRLNRQEGEDEQEDAIMDGVLDYEDVKGKLSQWV